MKETLPLILFEDNHIIAVNKRPGDIVQGDKTGDTPLSEIIAAFIAQRDSKPGDAFIGVTHRLDRPVSGVTLFAKRSKSLERLNEQFRTGQVKKIYWAIVSNPPDTKYGELTHYLTRNQVQNRSYASNHPKRDSKEAKLIYRVISKSDRYYLLEIELLTGRHHQIRSQLSAIGSPIKGDLKYGFPRSNPDGSISLHARSVRFVHPVTKEEIFVVAEPPDDVIWNFFIKEMKESEYSKL